jgi:hypothetical protein
VAPSERDPDGGQARKTPRRRSAGAKRPKAKTPEPGSRERLDAIEREHDERIRSGPGGSVQHLKEIEREYDAQRKSDAEN